MITLAVSIFLLFSIIGIVSQIIHSKEFLVLRKELRFSIKNYYFSMPFDKDLPFKDIKLIYPQKVNDEEIRIILLVKSQNRLKIQPLVQLPKKDVSYILPIYRLIAGNENDH